jgi:hypothetical protein
MSIEDIMRLLALRHHIVIVDSLNNRLYSGIVEDVPRDLWDLAVAGIAPQHTICGITITYGSRWTNEPLIFATWRLEGPQRLRLS